MTAWRFLPVWKHKYKSVPNGPHDEHQAVADHVEQEPVVELEVGVVAVDVGDLANFVDIPASHGLVEHYDNLLMCWNTYKIAKKCNVRKMLANTTKNVFVVEPT